MPNLCGAYISLLVGLERGDSAMLAAYDPPFLKYCVGEEIASRIDPLVLRSAYRRASLAVSGVRTSSVRLSSRPSAPSESLAPWGTLDRRARPPKPQSRAQVLVAQTDTQEAVRAVVLGRVPYGDHDLILPVLSADVGRFSVYARRPRSKSKGWHALLVPGNTLDLRLSTRRELFTLSQWTGGG